MPGRNRTSPLDESTATRGGDTHGLLPILSSTNDESMGGAGSSARVRQRYAKGRSSSRELVDCMFYKSVNYCRHESRVDERVGDGVGEQRSLS